MEELEDEKQGWEVLSSGQDMVILPINSLQLWISA